MLYKLLSWLMRRDIVPKRVCNYKINNIRIKNNYWNLKYVYWKKFSKVMEGSVKEMLRVGRKTKNKEGINILSRNKGERK